MAHLRLTPEEYRAIRSVCRAIHLRDDCFPIFRYYLAEVLHECWPTLAARVALLGQRELRLLFRRLRTDGDKERSGRQETSGERGLSQEEFRAVLPAAQLFALRGGPASCFREFLCRYFRNALPALADRLSRLSERRLAALYRRAKRPTRWRA